MLGALLAAAAVMGLLSGGASVWSSYLDKKAIEEKNATNLELNRQNNELQMQLQQATNEQQMQRDQLANDTSMYLASHAHQIEMADLEAAGLNPILAAGGAGAATPTQVVSPLGTASVKAGKVDAASMDLSGLANVLSSMSNVMLISAMMNSGKILSFDQHKKWYKNFSKDIEDL